MNHNKTFTGHIAAIATVLVWGTTFISTKLLLASFKPVEILFFRFVLGFIALNIAYPKKLKLIAKKHELLFMGAGLCGVTLYFLFENIALTFTMASNVGVMVSVAPFFTALLAHRFLNGEKLRFNYFLGFAAAILGIALISFSGVSNFKLNPVGDLLAVSAAAVWAVYSILIKKIGAHGYNTIAITRRSFMYGLVFMVPAMLIFDFKLGLERFTMPVNLLNILFLGLFASALCFAAWSFCVKQLGAVTTSAYIYLVPVVSVISSALMLHERITLMAAAGTLLTLLGLFISERRFSFKKRLKAVNAEEG